MSKLRPANLSAASPQITADANPIRKSLRRSSARLTSCSEASSFPCWDLRQLLHLKSEKTVQSIYAVGVKLLVIRGVFRNLLIQQSLARIWKQIRHR